MPDARDDRAARFDAAVGLVRKAVPKFRVRVKQESRLMRALGWLLARAGNPEFMTDYWTTVGFTTYRPAGADPCDVVALFHEARHAADAWVLSRPLFFFLYLLPLPLFPLLLAAGIVLGSWWLAAASAAFLLPLPAPFRAWLEFRAYRVTLWGRSAQYGEDALSDAELERHVSLFSTGAYYWMLPVRPVVRWAFRRLRDEIRRDRKADGLCLVAENFMQRRE
jgi:hypothetical protein